MSSWKLRRLEDTIWFPFDLDENSISLVDAFTDRIEEADIQLDVELANEMSAQLTGRIQGTLTDLVELQALGTVAHLINGWGNSYFSGKRFLDLLEDFLVFPDSGHPYIAQARSPRCDFHPWQSFAYCLMAGIAPNTLVAGKYPLEELALNSNNISQEEGVELGHLLFAVSQMSEAAFEHKFTFPSGTKSLDDLIRLAIEGHRFGHFRVCRKVHLTEGLLAICARGSKVQQYKKVAEEFLVGQMDALIALAALSEAVGCTSTDLPKREQNLRDEMGLNKSIENACYCAGHLIELICLAERFGYPIPRNAWNAGRIVSNHLNAVLLSKLEQINVMDNLGSLAHYRRGVTLLNRSSLLHRMIPLSEYWVDFDHFALSNLSTSTLKPNIDYCSRHYVTSGVNRQLDPMFTELLSALIETLPEGMSRGGGGEGYRKIAVSGWPAALHYELLESNDGISFELHFESADLLHTVNAAKQAVWECAEYVSWDPGWEGGTRLRLIFGRDEEIEVALVRIQDFIRQTRLPVQVSLSDHARP